MSDPRPRVLSGVQPTGKLHLGNYLGAISLWAENLEQYESFFCVVDLHALTIPEVVDPADLKAKVRDVAALYVASGIDPERATIFVQSHVTAHAELMWILNCVTPLGWLQRMTQFKSKSGRVESIGSGLLTYPILQAADILLYDPDFVPVGEDQRQHVELTRDIAQRFNHLFGEGTLKLPEALIRESGARIMGLDEPENKMSKSRAQEVTGHAVGLLDDPKVIKKAIMRAVTDTERETRFDHASPGVVNLLTIYQTVTGESRDAVEAHFDGKGYGDLKKDVAEAVIAALEPIQARYSELMGEEGYLDEILEKGADAAREVADGVLRRTMEACGLR
jgi:tryptophanyl-tRNA synthetase